MCCNIRTSHPVTPPPTLLLAWPGVATKGVDSPAGESARVARRHQSCRMQTALRRSSTGRVHRARGGGARAHLPRATRALGAQHPLLRVCVVGDAEALGHARGGSDSRVGVGPPRTVTTLGGRVTAGRQHRRLLRCRRRRSAPIRMRQPVAAHDQSSSRSGRRCFSRWTPWLHITCSGWRRRLWRTAAATHCLHRCRPMRRSSCVKAVGDNAPCAAHVVGRPTLELGWSTEVCGASRWARG